MKTLKKLWIWLCLLLMAPFVLVVALLCMLATGKPSRTIALLRDRTFWQDVRDGR